MLKSDGQENCPICGTNGAKTCPSVRSHAIEINCKRCGFFDISIDATDRFDSDERTMMNLSSWLRENSNERNLITVTIDFFGEAPEIGTPAYDFRHTKIPTVDEKLNRLLMHLGGISDFYGEILDDKISGEGEIPLHAYSWSAKFDEFGSLLNDLVESNYLKSVGNVNTGLAGRPRGLRLTGKGWRKFEEIKSTIPSTNQVFIAMMFHDSMAVFNNLLHTAINRAGFSPVRIDNVDHSGKIDDEIINQIRKSRLIVADLTGHRQNVYYEVGFAMGLGIPIVWTCKKSELEDTHFDIRQYNIIDWTEDQLKDPTENDILTKKIKNRIESIASI